ncbi:MAG: hypothetical protein A3E93_01975 [Candidatus Zambryskibacteria bacterium RIFCSPHIGHO2_12_FULL_43_12b]|nr:MAG: hypothetical protein A3E93_01975 [Candidatus Zambryskibacteria bacterium RIFCSPHIGHO2_12_FULL_43_12b]
MAGFFHTVFFQPLYNGFIFLMDVLPFFDAGVIIILFTIIIKFVLYPLSKKAVVAQIEMKSIEPDLKAIKEKYKEDKQEQAKRTMALYKEKKINPFASIFVILIQLPIVFALYFVFIKTGLPEVNTDLLYSFVQRPETININFLGILDITEKSIILALLAGISSFFQIRFAVPAHKDTGEKTFQNDLAKSLNVQMRYVFPVITVLISYQISGVVALYWVTSNVFAMIQERVLRKQKKLLNA